MNLQALQDRLDIAELLARYARGVDNQDWNLYRSVFTEDAEIDYSSAGAIVGSRDEVAAFLEQVYTQIPWAQHYITNVEIDLAGDTASVRAMFYNPMMLPGFDEPSFCGGFYHHDVIRTTDGWKSRRLVEENRYFHNPFPGA